MNIDLCLILGIIVVFVMLAYVYVKKTKEMFTDEKSQNNQHVNAKPLNQPSDSIIAGMANNSPLNINPEQCNTNTNTTTQAICNSDDYIKKTDLETIAKATISDYCPVDSSYDPADYVKKTEFNQQSCPKMPNLKDYVLKSTIPPIQKCPSCVCPKVKVEAGLCKKCPDPKNNCPKPKPCDYEQCKNVIKCEPWQKQVSCPKCPAPQPCPQLPTKVCPAITIPKADFKCPETKPCPVPPPCKDGKGRCEPPKVPKCSYKGVDTVIKEKTTEEMINELLESEDPKLKNLLTKLKNRLVLDESVSPSELNNLVKNNQNNHNNHNNVPSFEAAPTKSSSSIKLEHRELSNNEIKGNMNQPTYNVNNVNNDNYHLIKPYPKGFNTTCKGNYCPYNTNLNI